MKQVLLIDGNSIGFAAQNGTKLTAGDRQTQAIYGFLRSLRGAVRKFPGYTPIVLWDGKAQFRFDLFPGYKDRSGKNEKMDEMREAYKEQRPDIGKAVNLLGVTQAIASNLEADDLAAIYSKKISEVGGRVVLVTGDKDWMQLVGPSVVWYEHRQERERIVTEAELMDETGFPTPSAFIEGKALMGDTSDTIPGVGGFGEKGAPVFLAEFGSVRNFLKMHSEGQIKKLTAAQERLAKNTAPKPSKKYGEMAPARDAYIRNMKLVDLNWKGRPEPENLKLIRGNFDLNEFGYFCDERLFNSITSNLHEWVEPFMPKAVSQAA